VRHHDFCDHCEGCRPALVDPQTGKRLGDDSPLMLKVNRVWDKETTYAQRRAFIMVTVHNSRAAADMQLCQEVIKKIEAIA
jgi:hypothetical protein